jgi:hypothetical protein
MKALDDALMALEFAPVIIFDHPKKKFVPENLPLLPHVQSLGFAEACMFHAPNYNLLKAVKINVRFTNHESIESM